MVQNKDKASDNPSNYASNGNGKYGQDEFKFKVLKDAPVAKDLGGDNDVVRVTGDRMGQVRLTFTSSDVGNGDVLDGNNNRAPVPRGAPLGPVVEDGGLAVRFQLENADGTLDPNGPVSRFEDEGITFYSATPGLTFDVRDLPSGTQRGSQFEVVRLGTLDGDNLGVQDASKSYYINAGGGDDSVMGGNANDFLVGGIGNDTIAGFGGDDTLLGGAGDDTFIFGNGDRNGAGDGAGVDTILDYNAISAGAGDDTIHLSKEMFRGFMEGQLNASAFSDTGVATSQSSQVIYNRATGELSYDADGTGQGSAETFASLMNKPANVTAADFFVTT